MEEGSLVTPIALAYSGSANYVPNHLLVFTSQMSSYTFYDGIANYS